MGKVMTGSFNIVHGIAPPAAACAIVGDRSTEAYAMSTDRFHPVHQPAWQALVREEALDPALPIVDAHHHLFDRPEWRYTPEDFHADLQQGHRITHTVYLQCGERYRLDGPPALKPVGETDYCEDVARRAEAGEFGGTKMCAAIVGHADLSRGAAVREVLEAHLAASPSRFRGIRHSAATDPDPAFARQGPRPGPALLRDARFREGFAELAPLGLSFDAWMYHPQLDDLLDLARAFPDTPIVLNHVGGRLGLGGHGQDPAGVSRRWGEAIRALGRCPNVVVKLGGMGMRLCGFDFHSRTQPPGSAELAQAWRPVVETCLEAFGTHRAFFESNFPVDGCSTGYGVLWNAFKRLAAGASDEERARLFSGNAMRVYRLS